METRAARLFAVLSVATALNLACSPSPSDTPLPPPGLPGGAMPATLPPDHPPMTGTGSPALPGMPRDLVAPAHPARSSTPARVEVPAEVKATWKTVSLTVTAGGKTHNIKSAIGGDVSIPGGSLTLRVQAYLPAFQMGDGVITSNGNNPDNPAALVRLTEKGRTIAEGWVFQALPDFNSFKSEKVQVRLLSAGR
jgi:hypothetical protein